MALTWDMDNARVAYYDFPTWDTPTFVLASPESVTLLPACPCG
jgi:hypothetical protein